jgi:hypothetical protein
VARVLVRVSLPPVDPLRALDQFEPLRGGARHAQRNLKRFFIAGAIDGELRGRNRASSGSCGIAVVKS